MIRSSSLVASIAEEFGDRTAREQMRRRASGKSIKGRDPSLRWPHLYDILRAKGYDKEKAARISNSRLRYRKKGKLEGLPWKKADNKKALKALVSSSSLVFACHSKACAPPPVGKGGSSGGGRPAFDSVDRLLNVRRREAATNKRRVSRGKFPEIGAEGIRGDSKQVTSAEFQRLANLGQDKLDRLQANASPITGLDKHWSKIKANAYAEATQSWGGATVDAHTGQALPQGVNKWALTIKDKGVNTVSIPEGASRQEFDAAMDTAKERFRPILERQGSHLGIFHDDDLGRIDFDPVLVVDNLSDVHTIGAATRAIGGAYNFADGNGYWPPHVLED